MRLPGSAALSGGPEGPHGLQPGSVRRGVRGHACALRIRAQRRKQHKVERITIFTDAQAVISGCRPSRPAQVRPMPSRPDGSSRKSIARWRSGGAWPIRASRATRKRTTGPNSPPMSPTTTSGMAHAGQPATPYAAPGITGTPVKTNLGEEVGGVKGLVLRSPRGAPH